MSKPPNNIQLEHQQHLSSAELLPVSLLVNDLRDPLNIGSLFRLADSFAIEKIYLTGSSPVPPDRKIRKTARHTESIVNFSYADKALDIIRELKNKTYQIISLELSTKSIDISSMKISTDSPVCLIIGAENTGVDQTLLDLSEQTIHIPMRGQNSSMNVATATAIALFEISKHYS